VPILPVKTMDRELNSHLRAPAYGASVPAGENIMRTLEKIMARTLPYLKDIIFLKGEDN